MRKIEYVVMIVGAGGTGGNFAKEFARYMAYFHMDGCSIKAVLIDGDKVEQKNSERQPYIYEDVQQHKAVVLTNAIKDTFELNNFYAYPHYIDSAEDIEKLCAELATYGSDSWHCSLPVIIGCVDNHRARQCMHEFFMSQKDCIYFDAANEYAVGEIVLAVKAGGNILSPDRAFYYPEILKDTSPSAAEASCGSINVSAPQHLATNLMAANLLLCSVVSLLSDKRVNGGIIYFDKDKFFSRFVPYTEFEKAQSGGV